MPPTTLKREQLFELAWSEPMRTQQEEENARIGELERKTAVWVKSGQIRDFVAAVRERMDRGGEVADREATERWLEWAVAYADRLDPVTNGDWMTLRLQPPQ